jgi:glycerol-3-phosphate dehydrogenase (NAD(P)+)
MNYVAVLGDGAWGTACASVLADNGYHVKLWCYNADVAQHIAAHACNAVYLPGVMLDTKRIQVTTDIRHAVAEAEYVFEAIPVVHMRASLRVVQREIAQAKTWICLSKGIEQQTLLFPTGILEDMFGPLHRKAAISGPSFARDLVRKQLTAVMLATDDDEVAHKVRHMFANDYVHVYVSQDMIGVQLCGALKNGIALSVGILNGLGYGDNTQIYCVLRIMHEIVEVLHVIGGKQETAYGLAGIGDIMLTALGLHSKNVAAGKRLAAGISLEQLCQEMNCLPEGINTIATMQQLAHRHKLVLPIMATLHAILFEDVPVKRLYDVLCAQQAA